MTTPIRIAVGCSANNEDLESQMVLEYTLRKHASQPLEITWMQLSREGQSVFYGVPNGFGWRTEKWATPFSAFRWALPALYKYEGRAIYFDSDFIVMSDVAELWNQPMLPGKVVVAGVRYCCSMWDCRAARDHMPGLSLLRSDPDSHAKMIRYFDKHKELAQPFANGNWNTLDIGLPPDLHSPQIKAIHYTRMERQLHLLKYALPRLRAEGGKHWYPGAAKPHDRPDLQELFDTLYVDALAAGYTLDQYRVEPFGAYKGR